MRGIAESATGQTVSGWFSATSPGSGAVVAENAAGLALRADGRMRFDRVAGKAPSLRACAA